MSKLSKLLIAVGAIIGVLVAAMVLSRQPGKGPESDLQVPVSDPPPAATVETNRSAFFTKRVRPRPAQSPASDEAVGVSSTATNLVSAWEDKVDDILGSADSDHDKAKQMLAMFPQLPADGQEEVARHLSNLVTDQDYGAMRAYLTNASLPEAVLDILLGDALNRPNSLKLPALLDVARTPQHPKTGEAKDFLGLFLEEDYANDWDKWQAKMDEWLKANPD
jgi:hypothetical protein